MQVHHLGRINTPQHQRGPLVVHFPSTLPSLPTEPNCATSAQPARVPSTGAGTRETHELPFGDPPSELFGAETPSFASTERTEATSKSQRS